MPITLDPAKSTSIETTFRSFLEKLDYWPGTVMLDYSLLLHAAWRPLLSMLPLTPWMKVLDVGTGYGLAAAELAANVGLNITGVDIDPEYVEGARAIFESLGAQGVLHPQSIATFEVADAEHLPGDADTFDFVLVREVFQFLSDPDRASAELYRVTKPGGHVCVSDNDDDIFVSYPDPPDSFVELHRAIADVQISKGGDRRVGRKLSTYLSRAGFSINSVVALPEARHWTVGEQDAERRFMIEQIREARERVVDAGAMSAETFDSLVADYEANSLGEFFRFNARIVVVGTKQPATPTAA